MMFFAFLSNFMDLLFVAGIAALIVSIVSKKKKISQKEACKQILNNAKNIKENIFDLFKNEKKSNDKSENKKAPVFCEPKTED